MKKTILFAAIAAILSSCNEHILTDDIDITDRAPISVDPTNDKWDVKTRAYYLDNELYQSAQVYAYAEDGAIEAIANNKAGGDLKIPVITLPLGSHTVNAVAYSYMENGVSLSAGEVVYPTNSDALVLKGYNRTPVYVGTSTITVANTKPASIAINMERATAMIKFSLAADGINYGNYGLDVVIDQYTQLNCHTLAIDGKETNNHKFQFKYKDEPGRPIRYESENHFLCPREGYTTDVIVHANNGKIELTDTIPAVPLERGKITTITGKLNKADGNINFSFGKPMEEGETINL